MKSSETPVTAMSSGKYGESLTYDPEFRGPVKHRSCTDIFCLFLFVAFIGGWIVVAFFAFREGDPRLLLYPTDSEGHICGTGDLEDKKFLFFFDLMKCARPSVVFTGCPTPQVCVDKCPDETFFANPYASNADEIKRKLICKYNVSKTDKTLEELLKGDQCAQLYFRSTAMLGRCIPEIVFKGVSGLVTDEKNQTVLEDGKPIEVDHLKNATQRLARFVSVSEVGIKIFSDFKTSWHLIVIGLLISMVISLIWIILMRWIAAPMIWLSIILVLAFSAFACYYSSTRYVQLKDTPGSEGNFRLTLDVKSYLALRKTWLAFAIISGVIFAILFLVIIFLRKRILIAIALIKEASKAVGFMVTTLFFPVIPYILMLIFLAFWMAVALYIASSGKASFVISDAPSGSNYTNGSLCHPEDFTNAASKIKCMFRSYGLKDNIFTAHAYNLFGLFWGLFFAVGIGQVSLAGAFSTYYWTLDKSKGLPCGAAFTGFYYCIRYHLGSVAFGSLLIATVRMIRVMLEYIDQKLKKYDNKLTRAIMCCMKCCFWLLEKVLRFISKNAYIMIAIYGKNFCTSARKAFMLLMRNIVRVVVLDKITDFLLFMGKLAVVSFAAVGSFYVFVSEHKIYKSGPSLHYDLIPPIFITFGAYIIASGFFSVYGMAVDTLFLCFLEDCERNDGTPEKPYYMSKELMKILEWKTFLLFSYLEFSILKAVVYFVIFSSLVYERFNILNLILIVITYM
ncbi:choline transporter-like protein 2 isoform X2 [Stegodyphus dumicola]|uniref:choline transporter-like protein 2 isoform X2 n=1 Tax=Stegodyphus dumicola TaxID=202533 RepID=UPI0015B0C215|nr:choline transporter-like protein 2 isoform X2 [Stegodyphus dumicola]